MTSEDLADDYKRRAKGRRRAIATLFEDALYADVVRECQEAAELALKAVIREAGHSVPMTHDVSQTLQKIVDNLPEQLRDKVDRIAEISRSLRRDRELSFYGSEDITPSEFYLKKDAEKALAELDEVLAWACS